MALYGAFQLKGGKTVLRFIPAASRIARKAEIQAKGLLTPGTLFEELGLSYIGPVNGHDPIAIVKILNEYFRRIFR